MSINFPAFGNASSTRRMMSGFPLSIACSRMIRSSTSAMSAFSPSHGFPHYVTASVLMVRFLYPICAAACCHRCMPSRSG